MEAAWEAGQVIFLAGEPGVGKTRLAMEFASSKGRFLRHEGRPGDRAIPYSHFARAVRQMLESGQEIPRDRWVRRELARIVPELYPDPPPPISSHDEKLLFFEAMDRLLRLSARNAAAVVLDDTHHFHRSGVEFGDYLVSKTTPRNPLPGGLRWIHTFRPTEMPAESARQVETLVAEGIGVLIEISPLDDSSVRDLLRGLDVDGLDRLSGRIMALTGGNPLFIVETLKTLFESGTLTGEIPQRVPPPQRVGALIRQRLDRLSEDALQLARAMAVAGPAFTAALGAAVLGNDETRRARAVAELEAAQVARGERFIHDFLMEAVLGSTPTPVAMLLQTVIRSFCM
jgi:predicted ATPase